MLGILITPFPPPPPIYKYVVYNYIKFFLEIEDNLISNYCNNVMYHWLNSCKILCYHY